IVNPAATANNSTPTHDEIAAQAYEIYLREGCVEGRDMDHWLRAEAELRARANGNGATFSSAGIAQAAGNGTGAKPQTASAILPNSVVPPSAPIAQVSRATTPRRSGKREAAAAK